MPALSPDTHRNLAWASLITSDPAVSDRSCTPPSTMFWYSLIAQCLGLKRDVLQTNNARTTIGGENCQPSSTANMGCYGQVNGIQSIIDERSCGSSETLAYEQPSTPSTLTKEKPPLPSLTTPYLLPSNMIIGSYNRKNKTVSFEGSTGDLQFGATVLLENHRLRVYGPLLPTAKGEIGVVFDFKNYKVWNVYVKVPFMDVESRLHTS